MAVPRSDIQGVKRLWLMYRTMQLIVVALGIVLVRPTLNYIVPMEYFIRVEKLADNNQGLVDILIADGTVENLPDIKIKRKIEEDFMSNRFITVVDANRGESLCVIPVRDIPVKKSPWMERTFEFKRWFDHYPTLVEECHLDKPGKFLLITDFVIPWWFGSKIEFTLTSNVFTLKEELE